MLSSHSSPVSLRGCGRVAQRVGAAKAPPVLSATIQSSFAGSLPFSSAMTMSSSPSPLTSASTQRPNMRSSSTSRCAGGTMTGVISCFRPSSGLVQVKLVLGLQGPDAPAHSRTSSSR